MESHRVNLTLWYWLCTQHYANAKAGSMWVCVWLWFKGRIQLDVLFKKRKRELMLHEKPATDAGCRFIFKLTTIFWCVFFSTRCERCLTLHWFNLRICTNTNIGKRVGCCWCSTLIFQFYSIMIAANAANNFPLIRFLEIKNVQPQKGSKKGHSCVLKTGIFEFKEALFGKIAKAQCLGKVQSFVFNLTSNFLVWKLLW